jgi:hypothetical protein
LAQEHARSQSQQQTADIDDDVQQMIKLLSATPRFITMNPLLRVLWFPVVLNGNYSNSNDWKDD